MQQQISAEQARSMWACATTASTQVCNHEIDERKFHVWFKFRTMKLIFMPKTQIISEKLWKACNVSYLCSSCDSNVHVKVFFSVIFLNEVYGISMAEREYFMLNARPYFPHANASPSLSRIFHEVQSNQRSYTPGRTH